MFVCGSEGREGEGEGGVSGGRSEVEGTMRRTLVEGTTMAEGPRGGRSEIGKNGAGKRKERMATTVEGGKSEGGSNGKNEPERAAGFPCSSKVARPLEPVEGLEYIHQLRYSLRVAQSASVTMRIPLLALLTLALAIPSPLLQQDEPSLSPPQDVDPTIVTQRQNWLSRDMLGVFRL